MLKLIAKFYRQAKNICGNYWGLSEVIGGVPIRLLPQFVRKERESAFTNWIFANIKEGWTVFDIGAYVGAFTVAFAKKVNASGTVVAFEPTEESRSILLRHLKLNRVTNRVKCVATAVGDSCECMKFFSMGLNSANSLNYEAAAVNRRYSPSGEVFTLSIECTTLDSFVTMSGCIPHFIKIDVEGAELKVLRGGRQTLHRYRPIVACEVHGYQMEKFGDHEDALFSLARDLDYVPQILATYDNGIKHVALIPK